MIKTKDYITCIFNSNKDKQKLSFCNRYIDAEFHFLDYSHAKMNEDQHGRLVTCDECEKIAKSKLHITHTYDEKYDVLYIKAGEVFTSNECPNDPNLILSLSKDRGIVGCTIMDVKDIVKNGGVVSWDLHYKIRQYMPSYIFNYIKTILDCGVPTNDK